MHMVIGTKSVRLGFASKSGEFRCCPPGGETLPFFLLWISELQGTWLLTVTEDPRHSPRRLPLTRHRAPDGETEA